MAVMLMGQQAHKKYSLYGEKWSDLVNKAKSVNFVKDDYILDRVETFILEGYAYGALCAAGENDYVLDCGAYTGNTALYFSEKVGPKGKVFSFEPIPDTYKKLHQNIIDSKKKNVVTYNYAISDTSKKVLFSDQATPGARQITKGSGVEVQAISIDDFVAQNNIKQVNFIKLDIEGAEIDALNGCKETCKKFAPTLAVCIYHKENDFITIPQKILELDPAYRFYLKHNSNTFNETVLFAIKKDQPANISVNEEEVADVQQLWKIFKDVYERKQTIIKKHLLSDYIEKLKIICPIKLINEKFNTKNFSYGFFPVSNDGNIHYEFTFRGNRVHICLHFEGQWMKYSSILQQIIDKCELPLMRNSSSMREGCYFIAYDIYDIEHITKLMKYLISVSFPILRENKLCSETAVLCNIG